MPNKLKEINITQFLNVNSKGRVHGFKPGVDLSDLDEILETAPETVLVVGDSRTKIIEDLDFTGILHNAKHVKISKNIELLKCGINGNSIENIYIDNPCLSVGYFAAVGKRRWDINLENINLHSDFNTKNQYPEKYKFIDRLQDSLFRVVQPNSTNINGCEFVKTIKQTHGSYQVNNRGSVSAGDENNSYGIISNIQGEAVIDGNDYVDEWTSDYCQIIGNFNDIKKLISVDKNNIKIAKRIQHLLFPEDNGDYYFEQSLDLTNKYFKNINYWLIKHNNEFVGIIGLYVYKEYPEDAWVGWFALLPEVQGLKIGKWALLEIKQMATNKGYKNLRLYTNSHYNAKAVKVYEKLKGLQENYNNINDEFDGSNTLIFSWNLTGEKIEFWNNRILWLNELWEESQKFTK